MLNLIKNEWMKLWSRKGTWFMVIFLAVIIVAFTALAKVSETLVDNSDWQASLEADIANIEQELASDELSERERIELEIQRDEMQENVEFAMQTGEKQVRESVILDSYGIMSMVTLLTIIVAGGIVSTEFSQGTIKMLLSRPVSRWKVLTSKYVTVVLFSLLAAVITYIASVVSAFIFFPGSTESTVVFFEQTLTLSAIWGKSLYLLLLAWVNTMMIATIAFMLGVIFRSTSMAIGISMFLYFTGALIVMFLSDYAFAKLILFAHTNLVNYEMNSPLLNDTTMPFSVVVLIVYWIVFMSLSFWSFVKRDVTA